MEPNQNQIDGHALIEQILELFLKAGLSPHQSREVLARTRAAIDWGEQEAKKEPHTLGAWGPFSTKNLNFSVLLIVRGSSLIMRYGDRNRTHGAVTSRVRALDQEGINPTCSSPRAFGS